MPELPEVETIRKDLEEYLPRGGEITKVILHDEEYFVKHSNFTSGKILQGRIFEEALRVGKVLMLKFNAGFLGFHLGMSGQIVDAPENSKYPEHIKLTLQIGGNPIYYIDIRKFGWVKFTENKKELLPKGVDPLTDEFSESYFLQKCLIKNKPLKPLLMDQNLIAGIGNIYANEIMFCAGLHPEILPEKLNSRQKKKLYDCIKEILTSGVKNFGTTFSLYRNMKGREGQQQHFLKVYGKKGELCSRCGNVINKTELGGRSTFFCPECQRLK